MPGQLFFFFFFLFLLLCRPFQRTGGPVARDPLVCAVFRASREFLIDPSLHLPAPPRDPKALELHPDMQGGGAGATDDTAFKQAAENYRLLLEAIAAPANTAAGAARGGGGGGGGGGRRGGRGEETSWGEALEQQQRQAREILAEIKRNPSAYLSGFEKAKRQDAITRRRLDAAAAVEENAFEPSEWSTVLRGG